MPRPIKCRRVCHFPQTLAFVPLNAPDGRETVTLTVDEYETIRLIDQQGVSQEQCAAFMQVARTTVQRIYESARRKLAECIVEGRPLRIEGGDFRLCTGREGECGQRGCYKRHFSQQDTTEKEAHSMMIAVTYENGEIFQHFGHTEHFKLYEARDGSILSSRVVDTNGSGHGALAGLLSALRVDALICGGIGGGAQAALAAAHIQVYGGVSGRADDAAAALAAGRLAFQPSVACGHHGGDDGNCGDHGCGHHSCHEPS